MKIAKEWLDFLREQYPAGSRIQLTEMGSDPAPIPPGTTGVLEFVDDLGTFHVKWNNGRELGVVIGEDRFKVLPPEPTLLRLYMPLTADFYPRDEWGQPGEIAETWDGRMLLGYQDQILGALIKNRAPAEKERGIMYWYDRLDSVNTKVRSAEFTAEVRDGQLWGVAECQVVGELTPDELINLKNYLSGQASDGWGEGFEQQEIAISGGELYVHLWSFDDGWSIQSEQERFGPKLADGLPEMCFSTLPSTGQLICIKRGEKGYYPSDWETGDPEKNRRIADLSNQKRGITRIQEEAMLNGSMFGWDVPAADPKNYEIRQKEQMGGMTLG